MPSSTRRTTATMSSSSPSRSPGDENSTHKNRGHVSNTGKRTMGGGGSRDKPHGDRSQHHQKQRHHDEGGSHSGTGSVKGGFPKGNHPANRGYDSPSSSHARHEMQHESGSASCSSRSHRSTSLPHPYHHQVLHRGSAGGREPPPSSHAMFSPPRYKVRSLFAPWCIVFIPCFIWGFQGAYIVSQ
jgi:hypothetical protein